MKTISKPKSQSTEPSNIQPIHGLILTDIVPLEMPNKTAKRKVNRGITTPETQPSLLQPMEDVQVFTAKINAFGRKSIPVDAVVQQNKRNVLLDLAKDNFTFDQVFKDFVSDNVNLFVFDEVNIQLKEKTEESNTVDTTKFTGVLRMDKSPLSLFKDFLKLDKGLLMTGILTTNGEDISQKISPSALTLTSAASFLLPITDGITLKSASLTISLQKQEALNGTPASWKFSMSITGVLVVTRLGNDPIEMQATITVSENTLQLTALTPSVKSLFGVEKLDLNNVNLTCFIGKENAIALNAEFTPDNKTFSFEGIISPQFVAVKAAVKQFTLADIKDLFHYLHGSSLVLPEFDMDFNDVFIGLASADATLESGELKKGISIGGSVTVFDHTARSLSTISKEGLSFIGALEDLTIGPIDITKAQLELAIFTKLSGKSSHFAVIGKATIEGLTLACKVSYEKDVKGVTRKLVYAGIEA